MLKEAREARVSLDDAQSMNNSELGQKLFPASQERATYRMPDYEYVHRRCGLYRIIIDVHIKRE